MLSLRQVKQPHKLTHEALTWEQCAKLKNETLWAAGLRDKNDEAWIIEDTNDLIDADEILEANNYEEEPLIPLTSEAFFSLRRGEQVRPWTYR